MSDTALYEWIASGASITLAPEEENARLASEFTRRFMAALNPVDDLGPTCEAHEAAVASNVFAVHIELCAHGDEVYNAVWSTLSAPVRRALKEYVKAGKP
jgi:hypothetical protein